MCSEIDSAFIDVKMLNNGKRYANVECVDWNAMQSSFSCGIDVGLTSVHCV